MGIIIICIIICFLIAWRELRNFAAAGLWGFLGALYGLMLWSLLGGNVGSQLPMVDEGEEYKIYALNDSSTVEGASYLLSDYEDGNLVFRYVINTDKGKHIEEVVEADKVYIKEGDYEPTVKFHKFVFEKKWYYLFAHTEFVENYVEFLVPENTVKYSHKPRQKK